MDKKMYKLGIIGTGRIAHRFVPEARTIEGIEVAEVYNPRIASAERFAEELNIEYATDDIESFKEKIDAVYIATPHETHVEYCRQMLEAGKHVLCEKPMSFSETDAKGLYELASKKGLVLMEGMKTAYCPGFKALLDVVREGTIGEVVDVEACFSRITPINVREMNDLKYGGSFTEFGSYALLPIVKLLGTDDKSTSIWARKGETGVDVYTKTSIDYGTSVGLAKTGLAAKSEGQLVIAGTKGYILAPSPWWLTKYFEVRYEDPTKIDKHVYPFEGQGLRYEIQEFVDRMNGSDEVSFTAEESIWFAKQMEIYLKNKG
ncbi:MAG: Gfo/Idh/MocA family oxidoreductase [Agathobacter sp.]|nr:Gfo/Idh/MocA family oxidoreductase [Agathobacter sp.]